MTNVKWKSTHISFQNSFIGISKYYLQIKSHLLFELVFTNKIHSFIKYMVFTIKTI